jgi:cytochrome P450
MTATWDPDQFNPHDPAFLADPFPTYTRFREAAPIHRVELYGSDWIFRYADCQQVLTDTDVWVKNQPAGSPSTSAGGAPPAPAVGAGPAPAGPPAASPAPPPALGPFGMMSNFPPSLFYADPPLHTTLRSLLEPLFLEAITAAPEITRRIAEPLLATASRHGRIELISDYALPLPAGVLFTLLGIPHQPDVWSGLIQWQGAIAAAHDITQSQATRQIGATCSMALNSFFEGMLLANRSEPGSGLFAAICSAFAAAGLSSQEVQVCACDLLVAGYLSTTFILGTGVRNLLINPPQLAALRENPSLIDGAVEEMLRIDGPVQVIDRCAGADTEVGGRTFERGALVTAVVGSADHDPSVFSDPDSFLIDRSADAHLSFGAGIHHCIGAPLVRLVTPVAIQMLLDAFPDLALDGLPQWQTDPYLRAVTNLPLRF